MSDIPSIERFLFGRFNIRFINSAVLPNMKCLAIQSIESDTRFVKRAFYMDDNGRIRIRWFSADMEDKLRGVTLNKKNFKNIMVVISLMTIDEKLQNVPLDDDDLMWYRHIRGEIRNYLGENFDY